MSSIQFFASIIIALCVVSCTKKESAGEVEPVAVVESSVSNVEKAAENYADASSQMDNTAAKLNNVDNAITWLEANQASRPQETEAAWEHCKYQAQGQDVSVALNCMKSILDN